MSCFACVVELRGQLAGVGSFLPHFGSKDQTQVIKLSGKCHRLPGLHKKPLCPHFAGIKIETQKKNHMQYAIVTQLKYGKLEIQTTFGS